MGILSALRSLGRRVLAPKRPSERVSHIPPVSRSDIVRGLDDLIAYEQGPKFQSLAVILAKKRWPGLIASEWKWDRGRDAYAPPVGGADEMALAASITASIDKIKEDLARIRQSRPDAATLIFYTPQKVTNHMAEKWQRELADSGDGVRLIVVSREDIVSTLLAPENAALCRTHLGLLVPVPQAIRDRLDDARHAARSTVANWLAQPRLQGAPLIRLPLTSSQFAPGATPTVASLEGIAEWLGLGQRVLLTAPGGSGKTTTAVQLAEFLVDQGDLCFLVDLPEWLSSDATVLEYLCRSQAFLSRGVTASDVAHLAEEHHVTWLLNGWNEIADEDRARATARLRELDREFPGAGVLVATRSGRVSPPLAFGVRVDVQPLSSEQRRHYLNEALGDRAPTLLTIVEGRQALDSLTRVPLILAEVVELYRSDLPIPESTFGILEAMAMRIEAADQHRAHLTNAPIHALASQYLSALAMWATGNGGALMPDVEARRTVSEVADKLVEGGQLAGRPDPGSVVELLCAHHCLQRIEDGHHSVRFQHQRFQEFYAARAIVELIAQLPDAAARRVVEADVLNWPLYASATEMIAEAIGFGSASLGTADERPLIGERLVTSAFAVDPLFGASLARLCGESVWDHVRTNVGQRLRTLYTRGDSRARRYALAGMLATGSPDFVDIVEPLLSDDDSQIRLGVYRALGRFHAGTLGPNWIDRISAWTESQRVEFVLETEWLTDSYEIAEKILRADESDLVRGAALNALLLRAPPEVLERNQPIITDAVVDEALRVGGAPDWYPPSWDDRVAARLTASVEATGDPAGRIRLLLSLAKFREAEASHALRAELEALPAEIPAEPIRNWLGEVISVIQRTDQGWTDRWISERIARGSLSVDPWIGRVAAITPDLRKRLVERVTSVTGEGTAERGVIALLAKFADAHAAQAVLQAMYGLEAKEVEAGDVDSNKAQAETRRRLRDLAVALEPGALARAILETTSQPPTRGELRVVLDIVGVRGEGCADFGQAMSAELRDRLRRFLVDLEPQVLGEEDYAGHLKAGLALAVGRIGIPTDVDVLDGLIRADIERVRVGRAAQIRGERTDAANAAAMRWSTWHLRALVWLGETTALPLLLKLLDEPEYEVDAAKVLVTEVLGMTPVDQLRPVVAIDRPHRSATPPQDDELHELRTECTEAIALRLRRLLDQYKSTEGDGVLNYRLKELGAVLAIADRGESRDLILEVMSLPGQWDMWQRTVALERMVASGERLPTAPTLLVVNSVLNRIIEVGIHDQQVESLPKRLLSVLPFVDAPGRGVGRIREFLRVHRLARHHLRDLIVALGRSKSDEALELLVEMGGVAGDKPYHNGLEWVRAVAMVGTPRARRVLLSFVDPEVEKKPVAPSQAVSDALVLEIVAVAARDPETSARLAALCEYDLDASRRTLLAGTLARIGTREAIVQSLLLIRDDEVPPVPYAIERGLEDCLVERLPREDMPGAHSLVPRSGGEIRRRLFELWLEDEGRRAGAEHLLKVIDEWRLEYGKPSSEPRHPAIEAGVAWPPLEGGGFVDGGQDARSPRSSAD